MISIKPEIREEIVKRFLSELEYYEAIANKFEGKYGCSLNELEKKIELDLNEILDRLSTLTDAFNELVERVQKLEESLPKD